MPILFTAISHGSTILAKYAGCVGNFIEVTEQVLGMIIPTEHPKMTYSHMSYLFHYVKEENVVYLCITDDQFEQAKAFLFLSDIKNRFENKYGSTWIRVALPNNAMNSDFSPVLAAQMKRFSDSWDVDAVQSQVDDVTAIMIENIENINERGERIDLLIQRSKNLEPAAEALKISSTMIGTSNNKRAIIFYAICAAVSLAPLTYIAISLLCGGFAWSTCVGSDNGGGASNSEAAGGFYL